MKPFNALTALPAGFILVGKQTSKLSNSFAGCSKMLRCKAHEFMRTEAYFFARLSEE
jgi:hypothetical protein